MSYVFFSKEFFYSEFFFLLEMVIYSMTDRNKSVTFPYVVSGGPSTMLTTLLVFINVSTLISDKHFRSESEIDFSNSHCI